MRSLLTAIPSRFADTVEAGCRHSTVTYVLTRLPGLALTVLIMLLLKRHYSLAGAAQLDWILAPTATLVTWLTSANPVLEGGVGYVDFAKGIIIAPACAGVNFMIMAFGLAALCGLHQIRRPTSQLGWLTLALVAAYGLALLVNTMRIALSMALYQADIYTGCLTVARVHRLAGVGLYLSVLWLYFLGLRWIIDRYCRRSDRHRHHRSLHQPGWPAPVWYLLGAVGAPLANGAWRRDLPLFGEHCATVVLTTLAFFAVAMVMNRLLTK